MATNREQAIEAIESIKTGKGNTAVDVQKVLISLMEYTETTPIIPDESIKPFRFNNNEESIDETNKKAKLLYSFIGFEKRSVNFTFRIDFLKVPKKIGILSFKLEKELVKKLNEIIITQNVHFIVPIKKAKTLSDLKTFPLIGGIGMNLSIKEEQLELMFISSLERGDSIFTSIQIHTPKNFS